MDGFPSLIFIYMVFLLLFVWSILLIDGVAKEFNIFILVLKVEMLKHPSFLFPPSLDPSLGHFPFRPCPFKLTIIV
jgi:hypothetical protein